MSGAIRQRPRSLIAALMLTIGAAQCGMAQAQGEFPAQPPAVVPADSMLGVEAVTGSASVEHLGIRKLIQAGDRLSERDLIRTGDDGRLALRLARLGLLEVGPGAEIGVEKLPVSSDAREMKSIFSLTRGYLRVVWKHPVSGGTWPLYVYFGGQRAGVGAGEYFFDQQKGSTHVCVATGQIAVVPVTGGGIDSLPPGSCSLLFAEDTPETQPSPPEAWVAMRRDFSIDAVDASGISAIAQLGAQRQIEDRSFSAQPSVRPARSIVPVATNVPESLPAVAAPVTPSTSTSTSTAGLLPPGSTGDGTYAVNVGSYPENETATRQAQKLKAAGYGASVQPVQINGRAWYRVQLRGFATSEAARSKAEELQSKLGYSNLWVVRP